MYGKILPKEAEAETVPPVATDRPNKPKEKSDTAYGFIGFGSGLTFGLCLASVSAINSRRYCLWSFFILFLLTLPARGILAIAVPLSSL